MVLEGHLLQRGHLPLTHKKKWSLLKFWEEKAYETGKKSMMFMFQRGPPPSSFGNDPLVIRARALQTCFLSSVNLPVTIFPHLLPRVYCFCFRITLAPHRFDSTKNLLQHLYTSNWLNFYLPKKMVQNSS